MNFIDNEYLIPVFIDRKNENRRVIREIYRKTGIRAHIFSDRFSIFQKLLYRCHPVIPWRDDFLKESLLAFARDMEEYYCLVIVVCNDEERLFIDRYSKDIESRYVAVNKKDMV